jgi:hypothetical protein
MTTSHPVELSAATVRHRLFARVPEAVLAALFAALLTGAWLACFMFVPFDFTPPRP